MRFLNALYRNSIWHPDALDPDDFKYRNLKRTWLPALDLLSILVGILAMVYGSSVLNEMYHRSFLTTVSAIFITASSVALVGVAFPRLWVPEAIGKLVMLGLLGGYSTAVWVAFFQGNTGSGFVAAMLMYPLVFPLFRLQILGEEVKQRRATNGI